MLVHKLVFFCWLVATCFGETADSTPTHPLTATLTTDTTENSTATSTSPPTSTTQTPEDTSTTSKPSETTTKGQESSSTTSSTTVTESSTATSTSPPTSTTQTPEDTLTTSKPSETTTEGQESSSTTSSTTVTESSTATSTSPPTSTTQTPEDTSTTSKPSETTTTPGQESSSTTSSTTVTGSSTVTSTSLPTSPTTSNESTVTSSPTPSSTLSTSPATSQPTSNGTEATSKTTPGEPSTTTTTVPTTTKPPACSLNPCPFDSICVELFDGFTCQCFAGSFLSDGSCRKAKVFPGNLRLTNQQFLGGMNDTGSKIFLETATNIQTALKVALGGDPNYIESIVLKLRSGSIIATVDNIYKTTSNMTQESFDSAFRDSVQQCGNNCSILQNSTFTKGDLCTQEPAPCDVDTTTCQSENDGTLNCLCKTGYIRSTFSSRSCSACPSGQKVEKDVCVPCSFGYSGFNCNDSNLLAIVVISCVLGGLLLITLLAFTIYGCRTKPKDYSSPYPPAQETRTTWTNSNSNVPKIPRASANVNAQWDSSNLEMMESGSTRALVAKDRPGNGAVGPYSGMKTFTSYDPSPYYGRDNPRFVGDYERGTR